MKTYSAWIFGMVFILGFVYFAWNNYELPFVNIGKTAITIGKVTDVGLRPSMGGFLQNVGFVYKVDDKYFEGFKVVGNKYGYQKIGNEVKVEYSIKKPSKYKVINFYNKYNGQNKQQFYSGKPVGYYQIVLDNRIFYYYEFGDSGKITNKIMGGYSVNKDTLIVFPFILDSINKSNCGLEYLIISDSVSCKGLRDLKTKREYKIIISNPR